MTEFKLKCETSESSSFWIFLCRAVRNPCFLIGAALIGALLLFVLTGLIFTPYPPNYIDRGAVSKAPDVSHLFGTDSLGRDVLSRVMFAGRTSFATGVCVAALCLTFGTAAGIAAASVGGRAKAVTDAVLTRATDIMRCIPSILFAMMIISVFGANFINTVITVSFVFIPSFYRVVRGGVIRIMDREYILWARIAGIPGWRILLFHTLPNLSSELIVLVSMTIAQTVLTETALSYLGLGVSPPDPSWGRMLSEAQLHIMSEPWEAVSVGVCVSAMALGFNLLGDGLRDVLTPRAVFADD